MNTTETAKPVADGRGAGAETLADMRRLTGKSQGQVAAAMGVSQGRVSQIELTFPDVTFPVLHSYLTALGASVRFVIPGVVVEATALKADESREGSRQTRRERTRGDAGRFA